MALPPDVPDPEYERLMAAFDQAADVLHSPQGLITVVRQGDEPIAEQTKQAFERR